MADKPKAEERGPGRKAAEQNPEVEHGSEQEARITPPEPEQAKQDLLEEDRFEATDN